MEASKDFNEVLDKLLKAHALLQACTDALAELVMAADNAPEGAAALTEAPALAEAPAYAAEEVRGALARLVSGGKKEQVRAILSRFGADRFSDIPQEQYNAVMAAARAAEQEA